MTLCSPSTNDKATRVRLSYSIAAIALVAACAEAGSDAREDELVSVIARTDEVLIRMRPTLVAGKYQRMTTSPHDYYRGNLALWAHDYRTGSLATSAFAVQTPLVPILGDAHVENFGTLRATDGSFALEPNDFDASDHGAYLWDVRRLACSLVIATRQSNEGDTAARAQAVDASRATTLAFARAYATSMVNLVDGQPYERLTSTNSNPILADAFRRSDRDWASRRELAERTILTGGTRKLKRGAISAEEPSNAYADLRPDLLPLVEAAIANYAKSLTVSFRDDHFRVLDVVREFGSGVSSWPRIRLIVLVRGASDDPLDDLTILAPGTYLTAVKTKDGEVPKCPGGEKACVGFRFGISNSNGDTLLLIAPDNRVQAQVAYTAGKVGDGQTWGRFPNGSGDFGITKPTPAKTNEH